MNIEDINSKIAFAEHEINYISILLKDEKFSYTDKEELRHLKSLTEQNLYKLKYILFCEENYRTTPTPEEISNITNTSVSKVNQSIRKGFFEMHKIAKDNNMSLRKLHDDVIYCEDRQY